MLISLARLITLFGHVNYYTSPILTPCHVDNFSCVCHRNYITPIDDITDRGGTYSDPSCLWGDIPSIPPYMGYIPPPSPVSPLHIVVFGVSKGGIIP